jgi:F420H(2)-dependent quinone reductase
LKRVLAIGGPGLLIVIVVALVVLRIVGLDPRERRPGLWLTGERVTAPVTDWSFTDGYPTIYLQTRSRYLLPHSVTITCVAHNGQLYLTSTFRAGSPFPQGKLWTTNVTRDPHVRLKIGNRIFDETASLVTDPTERAAVLESKAKKYPAQQVPPTSAVYVFHVLPG